MNAYVGIKRQPSDPHQYSSMKPNCGIPTNKPKVPPRPERPFIAPPIPQPKVIQRPEDFPRALSLEPTPHKPNSDLAVFLAETKLPQHIRITESLAVSYSKAVINKGDAFLLHFIYDNPTIHASTLAGTKLRLPVHAEQKYEMLPLDPRLDDMEYEGTTALMNADPLPASVRVLEAHCSTIQDEFQEVDDIIEIEGFEHDEERGKLLVGKCGKAQIKYSEEMDSCVFTTMLSPTPHRMTQLKDEKFPQRVRIPDDTKAFSQRTFKEEMVLHLNSYSIDKCIVATRDADPHIYSIPVDTPIKFTHEPITGTEKRILEALPSLYPLVNTSWGLVDPTQGALMPHMETIPQPIPGVLQAWLTCEEGKVYACNMAESRLDDLQEEVVVAHKEMRRMKADLDSLKNRRTVQERPTDPSAPIVPPRLKCDDDKPPDIPKRPPASAEGPPRLPPRRTDNIKARINSDMASDSDDYEDVDMTTTTLPPGASPNILRAMKDALAKKEKELQEERQRVEFWKDKCKALENQKISATAVYEELPDFPDQATNHDELDEDNYLTPCTPSCSASPSHYQAPTHNPPRVAAPRSLHQWTVAEVGDFLRQHGMGQYLEVFRKNDVNGSLLSDLQECHLLDLTMTKQHASKLRKELDKLHEHVLPLHR
ncbi:uncharacterized protein LOC129256595 [Lytechinus pictus]|uniref:uncharacterized protein LOC129256595 n=1 Tax=Lytechinus pictus TaxID=7653 RepID=UPI0030B9DCFB